MTDSSDPKHKENNFCKLDVRDKVHFESIMKEYKITNIIHLASLVSATCEKNINLGMSVNIEGMQNALNLAKNYNSSIFIPSTYACFGPNLGKNPVPDDVIQDPTTYYGISKLYMEKLGTYFYKKFGTDFRCLRYPSIICPDQYEGHRTAAYPTAVIHSALKGFPYKMYLESDISLSMMYVDDCVRGTLELIEASNKNLTRRVYNFHGLSLSPAEYINALKNYINFEVTYEVDPLRNTMIKTWPAALDDSIANKDWGWKAEFTTPQVLIEKMIKDIKEVKNEK
jgi:threonine 3-dehydrogenase